MSRWSAELRWAGLVHTETDPDVDFSVSASILRRRGASRSARVVLHPSWDTRQIIDNGHPLTSAVLTLKRGGEVVLRAKVDEAKSGDRYEPIEVRASLSTSRDGSTVPSPVASAYYPPIDVEEGVVRESAHVPRFDPIVSEDTWTNYQDLAKGLVYPRTYRSRSDGTRWHCQGLLVDSTSNLLVIGEAPAASGTVRVTDGTNAANYTVDRLDGDLPHDDANGRSVAVVDLSSPLSGSAVPTDTASVYLVRHSSDNSGFSGLGGDIVSDLMRSSTLPVDLSRLHAVVPHLNRFILACSLDQQVTALELLEGPIGDVLPMTVVVGARGIYPVPIPIDIDDPDVSVVAGPAFSWRSGPDYKGSKPVSGVRLRWAYDADTQQFLKTLRVSAGETSWSGSLSNTRSGDELEVSTPWVEDDWTASEVATWRLVMAASNWRSYTFDADPAVYGPSGPRELAPAMQVEVTDAERKLNASMMLVESFRIQNEAMTVTLLARG